MTIIVVSDLHISAGPLDDFDAELETCFSEFLQGLAARPEPVELVINGDFLDFVQAPPWEGRELSSVSPAGEMLSITEEQSLVKLEAIARQHGGVFRALGDLLAAKAENRLVILPGNHDADFFWPRVRTALLDRVCSPRPDLKDRVTIHLEQVYRPPAAPGVWIEHGHQYDFCNWFFVGTEAYWSTGRPPIFKDRDGRERLMECVGTRFLVQFLNGLDEAYPFVDNVKPFSRFLSIFGASALCPGYAPVKAMLAVWNMLRFLGRTLVRQPRDLLGIAERPDAGPLAVLRDWIGQMTDAERVAFAERLRAGGFPLNSSLTLFLADDENAERLLNFLADHAELAPPLSADDEAYLSAGGGAGELTLARGFAADETKELIRAAQKALADPAVTFVVMGHTHETIDRRKGLRYINTGCWTRYYRFGDDEKLRRWPLLRSPSYERFPYQLNYAEIAAGAAAPVRLVTFREKLHDSPR